MSDTDVRPRREQGAARDAGRARLLGRVAVLLLPLLSVSIFLLTGEGVLRLLGFGKAVQFDYGSSLGWTHVPLQHSSTLGRPVRINEHGFRGGPLPVEKPRNGYRIVLVGDSFTFGYGVDEDSTYGALLGRSLGERLPCLDVQLINAGVNGYNTRQEAELLRRVAPRFRPDLVVVGLTPNDIMEEEEARTLLRYPRLKRLVARSALYQFFSPRLKAVLLPRERSAYDDALGSLMRAPDASAERRWSLVETGMRDVQRQGEADGFRPVVAVFPLHSQVPEGQRSWLEARTRGLGERTTLDVVELLPAYEAAARSGANLFLDEPTRHPNPLGHRIAAAELERYLVQNHLLPECGGMAAAGSRADDDR